MSSLEELKRFVRKSPASRSALPGGASASLLPVPTAPTAAILLGFRDGVAYEPQELWGISHFVEHILFRGSESLPSLYEISRAVEGLGGRISAYSTRDMTGFWVKTPPGQDIAALEVLTGLLTRPALAEASIAAESAIIEQERQRELGNPALWSSLLLEELLLSPAPSSRHPVGSPAFLGGVKASVLRDYIGGVYHRGNLAAAAAGNLSPGISEALVEAASRFPAGPKREKAGFALPDRWKDARAALVASHHKSQVFLSLGWKFPVGGREDYFAFQVLNTLLGAGYTSLLNASLRERENITYLCTTRLNLYGDAGVFKIGLALADRNLERALAVIDALLADVGAGRIPPEPFADAVTRHSSNLVFRMEDSLETAKLLGHSLVREGRPFSFEEYFEGLEGVDVAHACALAAKHWTPETRKTVILTGSEAAARLFPGAVRVQGE